MKNFVQVLNLVIVTAVVVTVYNNNINYPSCVVLENERRWRHCAYYQYPCKRNLPISYRERYSHKVVLICSTKFQLFTQKCTSTAFVLIWKKIMCSEEFFPSFLLIFYLKKVFSLIRHFGGVFRYLGIFFILKIEKDTAGHYYAVEGPPGAPAIFQLNFLKLPVVRTLKLVR